MRLHQPLTMIRKQDNERLSRLVTAEQHTAFPNLVCYSMLKLWLPSSMCIVFVNGGCPALGLHNGLSSLDASQTKGKAQLCQQNPEQ